CDISLSARLGPMPRGTSALLWGGIAVATPGDCLLTLRGNRPWNRCEAVALHVHVPRIAFDADFGARDGTCQTTSYLVPGIFMAFLVFEPLRRWVFLHSAHGEH